MAIAPEIIEKTGQPMPEEGGGQPIPPVAGDTLAGETTPEAKEVQVSEGDLAEVEGLRRELKGEQERHARLKGVAGRQSAEIARLKTPEAPAAAAEEPEPRREERGRFAPADEDGNVLYRGRLMSRELAEVLVDRDDEIAQIRGEIAARDDQAQEAIERQRQDQIENGVVDVGIKVALKRLGLAEDEETGDLMSFLLDAAFRRTATEMGFNLPEMDSGQITSVLKGILPDFDRLLGYRPKAQQQDNEQHRSQYPTKTGGAPGAPVAKDTSKMTPAELTVYYEEISRRHSR